MKTFTMLVPFVLDRQRFAVALSSVNKIVRAVEITPLPEAPDIVLGVINVGGRVIPVMNVRKRFGLPTREQGISDHLIIAVTPKRPVALSVDGVDSVIELGDGEIVRTETILPGTGRVEGVVKLNDGLLFIHDLARFLSLDEEEALDRALHENGQP